MSEKDPFVLYDYLYFFWKKKWLLLPIPILLSVLVVLYGITKELPYVGSVTIYTGSVQNESLTEPDLLLHDLNEKVDSSLKDSFTIHTKEKRVMINKVGNDPKAIESDLEVIVEEYLTGLTEKYEEEHTNQLDYFKSLEEEISKTEDNIEVYKESLSNQNLEPLIERKYLDLLAVEEENLVDFNTLAFETEQKLIRMEEPRQLGFVVTQAQNNMKSNLVVGFIFGVFLSILLLAFWKYVMDARRERA